MRKTKQKAGLGFLKKYSIEPGFDHEGKGKERNFI